MLFSSPVFIVFSLSLLVASAPYTPRDGELRESRRQAVDSPVEYHPQNHELRRLWKRAVPYSVVQVDGGSTSATDPPATMTIVQTLTLPPTTETLVYATAIIEAEPASTIVVTTTQEKPEIITAIPLPLSSSSISPTTKFIMQTIMQTVTIPRATETLVYTSVVTEEQPQQTIVEIMTQEIPQTITVIPPQPSAFTAAPSFNLPFSTQLSAQTVQATITIFETIAASPTAFSSTIYYDDGLWHTHYPVRVTKSTSSTGNTPTTFALRV